MQRHGRQPKHSDDQWNADHPVLADSSLMTSPRLRFWEMQLGGAFFTNELLRRVLPRYRNEIEKVNPTYIIESLAQMMLV